MKRIALTGAAGLVGSLIRPLLRATGWQLLLIDVADIPDLRVGEEFVRASVLDQPVLIEAFAGADLIVHLGGLSKEDAWASVLNINVNGTFTVLEAARLAGVRRVLLASSLHAVGYLAMTDAAAEAVPYPRPDTYYGVSKVAVEALGSLFGDRHGMIVISARLGTASAEVSGMRLLSTWLSPADLVRLIEVCAVRDEPGHRVVWAMSANTRGVVSHEAGHAIGYFPQDDAEDQLAGRRSEIEAKPYVGEYLAGVVIDDDHPLGKRW